MTKAAAPKAGVRKLRCAIYTRKSSEEGLDMEFNSLDAQRDACSAYIASQRSEGWVELAEQYDDGGISGATLERPGLKRLLADIGVDTLADSDWDDLRKVDRLALIEAIISHEFPRLHRVVDDLIYEAEEKKRGIEEVIAALDEDDGAGLQHAEIRAAAGRSVTLAGMKDRDLLVVATAVNAMVEEKEAEEADATFLAHPTNVPDYKRYATWAVWTQEEAVLLLMGINPDGLNSLMSLPRRSRLRARFRELDGLLDRARLSGADWFRESEEDTFLVQPAPFLNWAAEVGLAAPDELPIAIRNSRPKSDWMTTADHKRLTKENEELAEQVRQLNAALRIERSARGTWEKKSKTIFTLLRYADFRHVQSKPAAVEAMVSFLKQAALEHKIADTNVGSQNTLKNRFVTPEQLHQVIAGALDELQNINPSDHDDVTNKKS